MILYHGTGEPIDGTLRPGGYDGLLWTSDSADVARAYIPESGGSILHYRGIYPDDPIPMSRNCGPLEIARALGLPPIDVTYDDRGMAKSWSPSAPRQRELDAAIETLGYEYTSYVWLKYATVAGSMRIMPAGWRLNGQLFTLRFDASLRLAPHSSIDFDATAPAYHDLAFFKAAIEGGYDGVKIADAVRDGAGEIIGHTAIGLTPKGLAKATISSGPASHLRISEWAPIRAAASSHLPQDLS